MAQFVYKDARVEINSVDLSDHVKQATINYEAAELDDTAMGANTQSRLAGLKDWSIEVEFLQDFAASEVDATLFSLVGGAAVTVKVRPTSSAISATNPEFNGSAILASYVPLGGSVGDLAVTTARFLAKGDLTRSVA